MSSSPTYIDLFAGAGGLSEGFIRAGFEPVAHVEMDRIACDTLKTRLAYHYLLKENKHELYKRYLLKEISRDTLYGNVPASLLDSVINSEISSKTIHEIFERIDKKLGKRKPDIIIGGPPCQAYSLVGRARDENNMIRDKRNFLFKYYAEFLKHYRPEFFVFENVTGLLSAKNYIDQMLSLFRSREIGYNVEYRIINASEFGVVQARKRVIIIGRRNDASFEYPCLTQEILRFETRKHIFSDLPEIRPGETKDNQEYIRETNEYLQNYSIRNGLEFVSQHIARPHIERDLQIYRIAIEKWLLNKERLRYNELPKELKTHNKEDIFKDRFKVVDPDGPSHTLVAHIAKDGHYYIYPDLRQVRSISVREAARIQSFPDDYYFEGGRTAAFKQIGNAVPPVLANGIAKSLSSIL